MLKGLRKLFASEPAPSEGASTLADVLKHDWLELWYQPTIELKTLRLTGAEGLARARHPTRGVLAPGVFLPHASEADMLALTERVIITVLRDWDDCARTGNVGEVQRERAGLGAGRAADHNHRARTAAEGGELA